MDLRSQRIDRPELVDQESGLLEARGSKGPAALRYTNAVLGSLRAAGFSPEDAAHAFWLLDSYVYGHVIQETSMQISPTDERSDSEGSILEQDTIDEYPHLAEIAEHAQSAVFSFDREFQFGLDLILDALNRTVSRSR